MQQDMTQLLASSLFQDTFSLVLCLPMQPVQLCNMGRVPKYGGMTVAAICC